jgi:hypothetical protein
MVREIWVKRLKNERWSLWQSFPRTLPSGLKNLVRGLFGEPFADSLRGDRLDEAGVPAGSLAEASMGGSLVGATVDFCGFDSFPGLLSLLPEGNSELRPGLTYCQPFGPQEWIVWGIGGRLPRRGQGRGRISIYETVHPFRHVGQLVITNLG